MLFAHIVFFASLVTYLITDPVNEGRRSTLPPRQDSGWLLWVGLRALFVAMLVFAISGHSVALTLVVLTSCLGLPLLRRYVVSTRYGAELEIAFMAAFLLSSYELTRESTVRVHPSAFPMEPSKVVAILLISAIVLAALRGGTYIIRGLLRKTESLPKMPSVNGLGSDSTLDETEINRGRIIGNLERIILMIVVAKGSYEALGFLIAAKGLIRSEHFSNRDWAEYFLIGSLSSVLIALVAGWTISAILRTYWI